VTDFEKNIIKGREGGEGREKGREERRGGVQ